MGGSQSKSISSAERARRDASKSKAELLQQGFGGEAVKQLGFSPFNILILGDAGSGKSSLINTFISAMRSSTDMEGYCGPALILQGQETIDKTLSRTIEGKMDDCSKSPHAANRKTKIHLVVFCVNATDPWAQIEGVTPSDLVPLQVMATLMKKIENQKGICSAVVMTHCDTLSSRVLESHSPENLWSLPEVKQRITNISTSTGLSQDIILPMMAPTDSLNVQPIVEYNAVFVLNALSKITEEYCIGNKQLFQGKGLQLQLAQTAQRQCPADWSRYQGSLLDHGNAYELTDVSQAVKTSVSNIMHATWESRHVGVGRDSKGLTHSSFQITEVKRLENPALFHQYDAKLDLLKKETFSPPNPPVLTANDKAFCQHLNSEVNEFYLWHGTKEERIQAICQNGFDFRLAKYGMFGSGVYFAEKSSKSDEYTDFRNKRKEGKKYMFLARVMLGSHYLAAKTASDMRRPPCLVSSCSDQFCSHQRHDSVIGDMPGRLKAREFIVYDHTLCYPEYLVTYVRQ
ncbi:uncharacterized protein LOC134178348 isoform X2 [Corticium candelabrum]|uniref:uncharacterized protein LOC134178348 isoform X2 n=1 Tax=Corticium candelabrum TaxID=121492 RepID=UPI002E26C51E|nr:uncharacterized protein LOC134178348 isoform X2 [Corticium candelabrum]